VISFTATRGGEALIGCADESSYPREEIPPNRATSSQREEGKLPWQSSNWSEAIDLYRAAAEVSTRITVPERYGVAIEARSWIMARGWRRGMLKRVDVAYEGEEAFASVRFTGQFYSLKLGSRAAV
jgi:hypothetical protein